MPSYQQSPGVLDIEWTRGDDFELVVGVERDVEDDTFVAGFKVPGSAQVYPLTVEVGPYVDGFTDLTITYAHDDAEGLAATVYAWDLQWTTGTLVRTILAGDFTIDPDVVT